VKGSLSFEGREKRREAVISLTEEELRRSEKNIGGGFSAKYQAPAAKKAEATQLSGITINGKTIIRVIAAAIIIAVLFLLLFKNIHKRE